MSYFSELKKILAWIWIKNSKIRLSIFFSLFVVYLAAIGQSLVPLIFKHVIDSASGENQAINHLSLYIWLLFSYGLSWTLCQLLPAIRIRLTFSTIEHILTNIISNAVNKFIRS